MKTQMKKNEVNIEDKNNLVFPYPDAPGYASIFIGGREIVLTSYVEKDKENIL